MKSLITPIVNTLCKLVGIQKEKPLSNEELGRRAYNYLKQKPQRTAIDFHRMEQLENEFPELRNS